MTTQGNEKFNYNNHPFYSEKLNFALAHNGVLYNDKELRKIEKLPETKIETDSYAAVQLIDKKNTLSFDSLKFMAEKVEGSFCFTILNSKNELFIVKGSNPIALYDFGEFYIYASTEDILNKALRRLKIKTPYEKIKIHCGDIVRIRADGKIEKDMFDMLNIDLMEYRYLRGYGWDYGYNDYSFADKGGKESDLEKAYYDDIVDFAKSAGVSEEEIEYMLAMGLDYCEIEDILYDPQMMNYYLYNIDEDGYSD